MRRYVVIALCAVFMTVACAKLQNVQVGGPITVRPAHYPEGTVFAELSQFVGDTGEWEVVGGVALDPDNPKKLAGEPGHGVLLNGPKGHTAHLVTRKQHGDAIVVVGFMVPKGSNSGVYLQGRYEIQVLDSWGEEDLGYGDCGGIYERDGGEGDMYRGYPPALNASKAPGEWQSFEIHFRAPRFDENGTKTANAAFIKVFHNGMKVHGYTEVTGPTRAAMYGDERPAGPLMLQGDHGPVAYRGISIRPADFSDTIK